MREPPVNLPSATLCACLRTNLPLGHDSAAWVYSVRTADDTLYFLKVRKGVTNTARLRVPRYLHDHGVAQVIAPLRTTARTLWAQADGYALLLYPFVAGTAGKHSASAALSSGMAPPQWNAYGAILRQIHATDLAPDLAQLMQRETFVPAGAAMVRELEAHMAGRTFADPAAQDLATFWHERRDVIHTLVARAEELGRRLAQGAPFVLCHADIHTANVLLDGSGQVWIVDWDDTVLAPKERDLMFVIGGGISRALVGPREEELFLQGYGATTVDPLALAYYRYAWAVSDIGEYGAQVFPRPDLGAVTRRAAVDRFMSLFLPGNIVALAFASDDRVA